MTWWSRVVGRANGEYATPETPESDHPDELERGRAEEAYADYEALTDHRDEAELLAQEAEGQDVCDQFRQRARELREVSGELGLLAEGHANRTRPGCEAFYDPVRAEAEAER
jgi:hypothetical protein